MVRKAGCLEGRRTASGKRLSPDLFTSVYNTRPGCVKGMQGFCHEGMLGVAGPVGKVGVWITAFVKCHLRANTPLHGLDPPVKAHSERRSVQRPSFPSNPAPAENACTGNAVCYSPCRGCPVLSQRSGMGRGTTKGCPFLLSFPKVTAPWCPCPSPPAGT